MLGELTQEQIETLLRKQHTGRLACSNDGVPYIVPIHYHYDGRDIIAHSIEGKKILIMRNNPIVCFQIDLINDIFNWESVIAWGRFEEIVDMEEKAQAMEALRESVLAVSRSNPSGCSHGLTDNVEDLGLHLQLIFYRIVLVMKTGRFEKR